MSSLIETIDSDLKEAMKARRADELLVLRMLLAAIKNKKIELGNKEELNDEQVIAVVGSEIKKRKDSVTAYVDGGRQDLADKEKAEVQILSKYMPEQMDEAELEKIVRETAGAVGASSAANFGKVMGAVMGKVKGRADGNAVSAIVKKVLDS